MRFASSPITCRLAANHLCHSALISVVVAVGPRWRAAIDHRLSPRCTTISCGPPGPPGPPALLAGSARRSGDHEGPGAASSSSCWLVWVVPATFERTPTAYWAEVTTACRGVGYALLATAVPGTGAAVSAVPRTNATTLRTTAGAIRSANRVEACPRATAPPRPGQP